MCAHCICIVLASVGHESDVNRTERHPLVGRRPIRERNKCFRFLEVYIDASAAVELDPSMTSAYEVQAQALLDLGFVSKAKTRLDEKRRLMEPARFDEYAMVFEFEQRVCWHTRQEVVRRGIQKGLHGGRGVVQVYIANMAKWFPNFGFFNEVISGQSNTIAGQTL